MKQTDIVEKISHFQQYHCNARTVGGARNFQHIDTPAKMVKENGKLANNNNFLAANKVEQIDLDSSTQKKAISVCSSSRSENKTKRCLSLSPLLPNPNANSRTNQLIRKDIVINPKRAASNFLSSILLGTHNFSTSSANPPFANLSNTNNRQLIMSRSGGGGGGGGGGANGGATTNTSIGTDNYEYLLVDPKKIHLFVKAGQDGRSQGACPFCQDVFLQLLIKAQTNKFNFDVISINLDNPPKEFKELCIKPPVLIHGSTKLIQDDLNNNSSGENLQTNAVILSDVDEIAEYLDKLYPNSKLTQMNSDAKKVCLNVFSKFSFFIRDISSKSTQLEAELEKIDNYLRDNTDQESRFLNGNTMTKLDCSLLPKLQHIRVAGESIKKFRIPYRFRNLWKYIRNAYETDAFQKSCPPDREIIWHWSKSFLTHKDLLQIMHESPYKTHSLPDDLRL